MVRDTLSSQDASTHQIWNSYLKLYKKYAQDTLILKTRSEVKVTVTQKWYATLCYPKMYPQTKFGIPTSKNINSVQKLCGTGFSQFLLLCVILGPTSLWESYSCRPPLISPAGSVPVRASSKALISWKKSRNQEIRQQTKTIWQVWNALHELIWKWQYFHYNIWEWLFQLARNSWEIIKRDYTPYIWKT